MQHQHVLYFSTWQGTCMATPTCIYRALQYISIIKYTISSIYMHCIAIHRQSHIFKQLLGIVQEHVSSSICLVRYLFLQISKSGTLSPGPACSNTSTCLEAPSKSATFLLELTWPGSCFLKVVQLPVFSILMPNSNIGQTSFHY